MKSEIKLLQVTEDVTEMQLWSDGVFVGAGSISKPIDKISEQDKAEAKDRIVEVWLCG